MTKKKKLDDIYFPVPQNLNVTQVEKAEINKDVIKRIIQGAVMMAFKISRPDRCDYNGNPVRAKAKATDEQMEMVIHLIESLQPQDAIEAALASQFAVTYIRGMNTSQYFNLNLELFEFGHKALETLQKYRSKGAQQISVQYVHQGQIVNDPVVNIKTSRKKKPEPVTIEGEAL